MGKLYRVPALGRLFALLVLIGGICCAAQPLYAYTYPIVNKSSLAVDVYLGITDGNALATYGPLSLPAGGPTNPQATSVQIPTGWWVYKVSFFSLPSAIAPPYRGVYFSWYLDATTTQYLEIHDI